MAVVCCLTGNVDIMPEHGPFRGGGATYLIPPSKTNANYT